MRENERIGTAERERSATRTASKRNVLMAAGLASSAIAVIFVVLALASREDERTGDVEPAPPTAALPAGTEVEPAGAEALQVESGERAGVPALPAHERERDGAGGGTESIASKSHDEVDEILRQVRWDRLAEAITNGAEKSEGAPIGSTGRAKDASERLDQLSMELAGRVATASGNGRGEITHPRVVARVVEALLGRAGAPLSLEQTSELRKLAREYERAIAEAVAVSDRSARLERLIDEIELKESFLDDLRDALTPAQRDALEAVTPGGGLVPKALEPFGIAELRESPIAIESWLAGFEREVARELGLLPDRAAALSAMLRRSMAPLLDRRAADLSWEERAMISGGAQAQVLGEIIRDPGVNPEAKKKIQMLAGWMVPKVF